MHTLVRHGLAALLLISTSPAIAQFQGGGGGFNPAPVGQQVPLGNTLGNIEFLVGFAGEESLFPDNSTAENPNRKGDLELAMGIIPSVEQAIGETVSIGAEMMFLWITTSSGDVVNIYRNSNPQMADIEPERRLVLGPHGRIRMSFPVSPVVKFDSYLAVGASILTEADDRDKDDAGGVRMGWGLRFGFGVSALLNEAVSTFMSMGYYTSSTYGDGLEYELKMVPFTLGLRANF